MTFSLVTGYLPLLVKRYEQDRAFGACSGDDITYRHEIEILIDQQEAEDMKRLCIIIPTRNHADYIRYYIERTGEALSRYDVDLIIGDSSDDDKIRDIVENSGNRNIIYKYYSDKICRDGEQKVFLMFSELALEYEYLWLCGDGYVPSLDSIFPDLLKLMETGYDLVSMMTPNRSHLPGRYCSTEYTDCRELFHDLYWHLTLWGTCFFKNSIAEYFVKNNCEIGGRKSSFIVLSTIFRYFAENECLAYNYVGEVYTENIYKSKSTWRRKDYLLVIWARVWCESIDDLPACYDSEKEYVKKSVDDNMNYFFLPHLLNWKCEGDLSLKSVRENREYIPKVTDRPLFTFYIAALFPSPILKVVKQLYLKSRK